MSKLIPVTDEALRNTRLGDVVRAWRVWQLIRAGELGCVRMGRRVFLTDELIEQFIARGGAK